ncbi:MAG: DHHA1 domain-containing protein, partial [Clostridia bacterium]|nr:DHHA1 domain-containing protein [Clostridia bacterium]
NQRRRAMEKLVIDECEEQLSRYDFSTYRAIILYGDGWNPGVVGLAASRLVEKYGLPAILLARDGDSMTGSCRSVPGVNIHSCLVAAKEHIARFGGHSQAAGLTIESSKFDALKRAINEYIVATAPVESFIPAIFYDCEADIKTVTPQSVKALEDMEPTGFGNPPALLKSEFTICETKRMGSDGSHASFTAKSENASRRGVWFGGGSEISSYRDTAVEAVYAPSINEFRGEVTAQLQIKAVRSTGGVGNMDIDREEALVHGFITQALYNKPYIGKNASIGVESLKQRLSLPEGVLIVAGDSQSARHLASDEWDYPPDIYMGRYPEGPRPFNAICVLPAGDMPEGYDMIACAGLPAWLVSSKALDVTGIDRAWWLDVLPGVDELRKVYVACRLATRADVSYTSDRVLTREVSRLSGVYYISAQAGLVALDDMGLIQYDPNPVRLSMLPMRKLDPLENQVFGVIAKLKAWGVLSDDRQPQ